MDSEIGKSIIAGLVVAFIGWVAVLAAGAYVEIDQRARNRGFRAGIREYHRHHKRLLYPVCLVVFLVAAGSCWLLQQRSPFSGENPIVQWGPLPGENRVFASIDTRELKRGAERYRLPLVCVGADATAEARDDERITKSPLFEITGARRQIELTLRSETLTRVLPVGTLQFYALAVPREIEPEKITTINNAVRNGAIVLGVRGLSVRGTPLSPRP